MAMRKRILAVLVCAVFAVVLAAPLAQSEVVDVHVIDKYENGPPSTCAKTWSFTAPGDGIWYAHVENSGMRWIIIDMVDEGTGDIMVDREMYRFAVYGNDFDADDVPVTSGHVYSITVTPNGPLYTYVTVYDVFEGSVIPNEPPVAAFSFSVDGDTVSVDASASEDSDGTIVSYEWVWGDGTTGTGMTATHTYTLPSTRAPPAPYVVFGMTYVGTTPLPFCDVTITDVTTSAVWTTTSGADGKYLFVIVAAEGDTILVEAVNGDLYGSTTGVAIGGSIQLDVVLEGETPLPYTFEVTLTVTDDDGATNSVTKTVTVYL